MKMNYRAIARNAGTAFIAQGVAMMLSIIQTLLVPKLLGTTEYGYWQLFIFYTSYVGFAHLGLNDGVYLIAGGQTRDVIDKKSVNSQFFFGVGFQLVLAAIIVLIAMVGGFGADRKFVIVCTGIFLTIQNAANFLSYLLQAMNETRRSSYSTIIERLTFLVPLTTLLVVRCHSFRPFVIAYIFSSVMQLCYCVWSCRDFIYSGFETLMQSAQKSWISIRVGFKLMIANIASQLILGIAQFAIDATWGINTFGELSFALSMVNFFLAFVSQASMVLFPALRQVDMAEVKGFFRNARDLMSLFFPAIYVLYYPMVWLLSVWLPKYASSFVYFVFLIPICVFDSKMNICCTTFFKVLREEKRLLVINACTCVASGIFTLLGVWVFKSIFFVIGGAVAAIVGRCLYSEAWLTRQLEVTSAKTISCAELLLTIVFIVTALIMSQYIALASYCAAYALFLFAFRRRAFELVEKTKKIAAKR